MLVTCALDDLFLSPASTSGRRVRGLLPASRTTLRRALVGWSFGVIGAKWSSKDRKGWGILRCSAVFFPCCSRSSSWALHYVCIRNMFWAFFFAIKVNKKYSTYNTNRAPIIIAAVRFPRVCLYGEIQFGRYLGHTTGHRNSSQRKSSCQEGKDLLT